MSRAEIIEQLPKLSAEDRAAIKAKLDELAGNGWLDDDEPLTGEQRVLLDARLDAYEKNPDAGSSWEEVEARIRARLKQ